MSKSIFTRSLRTLRGWAISHKLPTLLIICAATLPSVWWSLRHTFPLTEIILFWTLLALIWYADETRKMKEQLVYQNILTHAPYLTLHHKPHEIYIKNLGPGDAFNISIEILKSSPDLHTMGEFQLTTLNPHIDFLEAGAQQRMYYNYSKKDETSISSTFSEITGEVELGLQYNDKLLLRQYTSIVRIPPTPKSRLLTTMEGKIVNEDYGAVISWKWKAL